VAGLSIFDPIYLGIDENGRPVYLNLVGRNVLVGGEPGSGKSVLVQNVLAHAALSGDVRLVLLDGKEVELGMWEQVADVFVGPDLATAIAVLRWLQAEIGRRTSALKQRRLRKITRDHGVDVVLVVVDEIALYAATLGGKDQREEFGILLRDVVARGRAVGIPVVGATHARRRTSSRRRCGTSSGTGARSGAPPTSPPTSSSGSAGPVRATARSRSPRRIRASAGSWLKKVGLAGSRPPTCPTPTSMTWSTAPPTSAAPRFCEGRRVRPVRNRARGGPRDSPSRAPGPPG
jgi:FtsK/SpoIIIE family